MTYKNEPILTIYYSYNPATGETFAKVGDQTFATLFEAQAYIDKVRHGEEATGVLGDSSSESEGS